MGCNETGQVSANAAEIYEEIYLPALFEEWPPRVIEAAQVLQRFFASAGFSGADIQTHLGTARFASIETWIYAGAKGWKQDDSIDNEQLELLLKEAEQKLAGFVTAEGRVAFSAPAHIVTANKPAVSG